MDCIIAAICMENSLALLHKEGDFDVISADAGLNVLGVRQEALCLARPGVFDTFLQYQGAICNGNSPGTAAMVGLAD